MPELAVEPLQERSISEGETAVAVRLVGVAREEVLEEGVELGEEDARSGDDVCIKSDNGVEETVEVVDCAGVEVAGAVDVLVEVADCIVVEVGVVLDVDSGVDEGVEVLDEEDCVRLVGVEEDAVLVVELDVVEEDVTSEDVEVVASNETVDVAVEDESAVWAEEKCMNERPSTVNSTSPPAIPIRNELCFMDL
jgi:hypothetical protein